MACRNLFIQKFLFRCSTFSHVKPLWTPHCDCDSLLLNSKPEISYKNHPWRRGKGKNSIFFSSSSLCALSFCEIHFRRNPLLLRKLNTVCLGTFSNIFVDRKQLYPLRKVSSSFPSSFLLLVFFLLIVVWFSPCTIPVWTMGAKPGLVERKVPNKMYLFCGWVNLILSLWITRTVGPVFILG